MLKKYWLGTLLTIALVLSASCSTLNVGNSNPDRAADAFTLNVMDESYFNGSHVDGYYLTTEESEDHVMVSINARGAADLKALYFDLTYDADSLRPMGVVNSDNIASAEERLTLTHIQDRGVVNSGQMVVNPDWHEGFSGDGLLATVNFRKENTPLLREISKVNTSAAAAAIQPEWDGTDTLTWYYASPGDYDQNGEVNVADLAPLGQNFLDGDGVVEFGLLTSIDQVDGDNNNIINVSDLTPIGQNFGNSCNGGYNVYAGNQVTEYPATNGGADIIAALDNVAFSASIGTSADRKSWSYTVAAPDGVSSYWVRALDTGSGLGTPSEAVGGDTSNLPQLRMDAPEPPGAGTSVSPYMLNDALVANTYTFHLYTDDTLGTEITGDADVLLLTEAAGALDTVNQATGEVTFDNTFLDTTFYVSATVNGVALTSDQRIYFRIELAPVGLYIFTDPADADWSGLSGDGLTEGTAFAVVTNSFNTDGLTEFSFVANNQSDNAGTVIDVNTLTWSAGFPFMVTNNWSTAGTATFEPNFTNTNVFAQDAELNNSNDIWVYADNLPE